MTGFTFGLCMTLNYFLFLPFLAFLFSSCQAFLPKDKAKQTEVALFLEAVKDAAPAPGLKKRISTGGRFEELTISKANLDRELSFFSKAVLSEAYLKGYYKMSSRVDGIRTVVTFEATGSKPEVRVLNIIKDRDGRIEGLSFQTLQDNYLYKNTLEATVFARYLNGKPLLIDYRVAGNQRMLVGDPYQFDIYAWAL